MLVRSVTFYQDSCAHPQTIRIQAHNSRNEQSEQTNKLSTFSNRIVIDKVVKEGGKVKY